MRVISYLSYLSSNSFWKEEALKICQWNAAIYHHQAEWNEQKNATLRKTQINLSIKELNCVPEPLRMAAYDLYLGTFVGIYPNSS